MALPELERWLQDRADRRPVATSIPMLDGYVAAIVAGPVSIDPLDWICPLLAVDADAFNHGGTSEFTAICAVARRHNDISRVLSSTPERFGPMHRRKPNGEVDPRPWCRGFYAAMRLRMSDWAPLLDTSDINHALLLPILLHCRADQGRPLLGPPRRGHETREFLRNAHDDISSRRRGHAPILDADPLRPGELITAHVGAHTGYDDAADSGIRDDKALVPDERTSMLLANSFCEQLHPGVGAVLNVLDLRFQLTYLVFSGSHLLAGSLQHVEYCIAALLKGKAVLSYCRTWRRRVCGTENKLEAPNLDKDLLKPLPQFGFQGVRWIGRYRPP